MKSDALPEARDIEALLATIERWNRRAFNWRGARDCVRFAFACAEAQTGIDPMRGLHWNSKRDALRVARSEGGLEAAIDARFARRVAPSEAKRGDIAALPDRLFGIRLLVVEGASLVAPGARGLGRQPRQQATIAWDVMSIVPAPEVGRDG